MTARLGGDRTGDRVFTLCLHTGLPGRSAWSVSARSSHLDDRVGPMLAPWDAIAYIPERRCSSWEEMAGPLSSSCPAASNAEWSASETVAFRLDREERES